ncbi:hypothetical protein ACFFMN_22990 [Planobispora siamensis]|uniref:Uncharacterized protein n=1 Tax=Planobispora siamensis TaxID=936338 RepID=A0A8J3WLL8_9ACTN|nr:hypothetical protein [Planobispora siamensis]GIH95434.1 hypothetical protein Psi01_60640 [Planobispora siamensis]
MTVFVPHENAERWDFRAARTILTGAGNTASHAGSDGFALISDGWDVAIVRIQDGDMFRPRTGTARTRWEAALNSYARTMTESGWQIVRTNAITVVVRAPLPETPQTTARLHRIDVGHHRLTFDGHPGIGGEIRMHLGGTSAGAGGYHAYSHTGRLVFHRGDITPAVEALAHHYGLPFPIQIHH